MNSQKLKSFLCKTIEAYLDDCLYDTGEGFIHTTKLVKLMRSFDDLVLKYADYDMTEQDFAEIEKYLNTEVDLEVFSMAHIRKSAPEQIESVRLLLSKNVIISMICAVLMLVLLLIVLYQKHINGFFVCNGACLSLTGALMLALPKIIKLTFTSIGIIRADITSIIMNAISVLFNHLHIMGVSVLVIRIFMCIVGFSLSIIMSREKSCMCDCLLIVFVFSIQI